MTAHMLAVGALEIGQTMSLCGNDSGAAIVMISALGLIAKYHNSIPDTAIDRFDEMTLRVANWSQKKRKGRTA